MTKLPKIDISKPKFDQSTFLGRVKHFMWQTNPLNIFATKAQLERARQIVLDYRAGKEVPEVKTVDDLWKAKYLYDSAFHPETGEKQIIMGRMSCQVPLNTALCAGMLIYSNSPPPVVIFWQWLNQSCMAVVNYTNRSGTSVPKLGQLLTPYVLATTGAVTAALSLNRFTAKMHPLIGKFVPFAAVAAGNAINVPIMRINEIRNGITLYDNKGNEVGLSRRIARKAITLVVISRIAMAAPVLLPSPIFMHQLKTKGFLKTRPHLNAITEIALCALLLLIATPVGLACFPQQATAKVSSLEKDVQEAIQQKNSSLEEVWYNKGL